MVELVVSVGILMVITLVILVNQSTFGGNILVGNLAYDVGLSVRQAQVFGLAVREFGVGTSRFNVGYGVHFDINTPHDYFIFADVDKNNIFNTGDGTEEVFSVGRGYSIKQLCATAPSAVEVCSGTGSLSVLDITFLRPDPDAYIRTNGDTATLYQRARIIVQSPQGVEREVTIESTGQISVSQGNF